MIGRILCHYGRHWVPLRARRDAGPNLTDTHGITWWGDCRRCGIVVAR